MTIECSFYACTNNSESSTVSFHKFPEEPESCEKWVDFCQSDELNERFVLEGPKSLRFKFVCSDHFRPQCYVDPKYTFKGLRNNAEPTVEKGDPDLLKSKPSVENNRADIKIVEEKDPMDPELLKHLVASEPVSVEMIESCQCDIEDEFREKFLEELTKGEALVRELKVWKAKTRGLKKSISLSNRNIQTTNDRINAMSRRVGEIEKKHGIQVELSSGDEVEMIDSDYETHRISKQD